jgi:hypothetical protein
VTTNIGQYLALLGHRIHFPDAAWSDYLAWNLALVAFAKVAEFRGNWRSDRPWHHPYATTQL